MVDLYPYSGRQSGSMSDADHEDLWAGWADGVYPGQATAACQAGLLGGQWVVYPGKLLIAGHVLNIDTTQYGTLPTAGVATRRSIICAYVNRSTSPWTYGVQLVVGSPGGGRPAINQSRTGLYQVPLRAFDTAPGGAVTFLTDERVFLQPAGSTLVRAAVTTPTNIPATITGADGQSTSLLRVQQYPGGPYVFAVAENGHVGIGQVGGASTNIGLWVKADSATDVTCRLVAIAGQTGRALQILDGSNNETFSVSPDGNVTVAGTLTAANHDVTSWATYTPVVNQAGGATFSTRTGRWRRIGVKTVAVNIQLIVGVAGSTTSPNVTLTLPTAPSRAIRQTLAGHSENPGNALNAVIAQGGSGLTVDAVLMNNASSTRNLTGDDLDAGMILTLSGVYEEA